MAVSFMVTVSEMRSAAGRISRAADDFERASQQVLQCAAALGDSWEGDSQAAFMAEQQRAHDWYVKMMRMVREHVRLLQDAAVKYQEADSSGAQIIRGR